MRIAPDATRILANANGEILVSDIKGPSWTRVAAGSFPMWASDSTHLVFLSIRDGVPSLFRKRVDRTDDGELLTPVKDTLLLSPGGWVDDRRFVFTYGTNVEPRLGLLDVNRVGQGDQTWEPWFERDMDGSAASVSRDGRWIAYQSYKEFNKFHVYVSPVSEPNVRYRVSTEQGGSRPVWSKEDARELFYTRVDDGAMMAVRIETPFKQPSPVKLFDNKGWRAGPAPGQGGVRYWDLAPGDQFLMVKDGSLQTAYSSLRVVLNWTEELRQRTATD